MKCLWQIRLLLQSWSGGTSSKQSSWTPPVSDSLAPQCLCPCCHCLLTFFSRQPEISAKAETKPLTSVAPAGHKGRARLKAADPVRKHQRPGRKSLGPQVSSFRGPQGTGSFREKFLYPPILSQTVASALTTSNGRRKPSGAAPSLTVRKKLVPGPRRTTIIPETAFSGGRVLRRTHHSDIRNEPRQPKLIPEGEKNGFFCFPHNLRRSVKARDHSV